MVLIVYCSRMLAIQVYLSFNFSLVFFSKNLRFHQVQPNSQALSTESLKGSQNRMGDGWIFLKTSAPLSFLKDFRKKLFLPGSIWLNSICKQCNRVPVKFIQWTESNKKVNFLQFTQQIMQIMYSTYSQWKIQYSPPLREGQYIAYLL